MARPKKITEKEWQERFKTVTRGYTQQQYEKIFSYESNILGSIESAIKYTDLRELSTIDEKIANYHLELLCKFAPEISNESPTKKSISLRAKALTWKRLPTWKDELLKQRDAAIRNGKRPVIERDEDGETIDMGFSHPQDWDLGPNGTNPYWTDPETICIRKGERKTLEDALRNLSLMKKKHTEVYIQIAPLLLSGIKVGKRHAEALGIREEEVASMVFETIKVLKEIVGELCPATAERQKIAESQKFLAHKCGRKTFEELKKSYRDTTMLPEPVTIRDWKVSSSQKEQGSTTWGSPSLAGNLVDRKVAALEDFKEAV
ncbi:MAG: hypothetical protein ABSB22_05095 [Thermodesulfobacteriota bacterium]|jgi:hypothetical protein